MQTYEPVRRDFSPISNYRPRQKNPGQDRTYIASHAAGAVIYLILPDGTVELLLIPYTIRGETTHRCIMGKRDSKNESPTETLCREVGQEAVDTRAEEFHCEFADRPIILTELVPDQEDPRGFHLKIFQLVKLVKGVLRTKELQDDSGRFTELLGPPKWVEIEFAIRMMMGEAGGKRVHIEAVKTALVALMAHRKVYDRYADVVSGLCSGIEVKPPSAMVLEYLKRFD